MSRLLFLSCSKRKRSAPKLLPAVQRYDGPVFRVLRRYLRENPTDNFEAYVLSAKFGLIDGNQSIPDYDQKLTSQRSNEIKQEVELRLSNVLGADEYDDILVCASGNYISLLTRTLKSLATDTSVKFVSGTPGRQLSLLHRWLYGANNVPAPKKVSLKETVTISVRGADVTTTPAGAMEKLQDALGAGKGKPDCFQSWYALIDKRRVSIKWAVSQLTGLPVSAFHTDDAKKTLRELGITVYLRE